MPTIMISIMPDGGIPVDKMEEDDEGNNCPLPTQDEELNAKNLAIAEEDANYHDPSGNGGFRQDKVCGSCAAYNQTEDMMDCIGDETGNTGYCQIWKFVCMKEHTCNSWTKGGPITSEKQSNYKEYL